MVPEVIYYNGKILTVDSGCSIQQAIGVCGENFTSAGSNEDVLKTSGPGTRKIDLKGKTVIPGINEGHAHALGSSVSEIHGEIPVPETLDELRSWLKEQVSQKPEGEWIVIPRIFPTRIKEYRLLDKDELDQISPDHPVFQNASFAGVVNSAALKKNNITKATDHPGLLKHKKTGEPTGVLRRSAEELLNIAEPVYTVAQKTEALRRLIHRYNALGITSLTDNLHVMESFNIYRDLKERGELTARTHVNLVMDSSRNCKDAEKIMQDTGTCTGEGDEWLRMGPSKVYLDGGILTGTAFLREPWGPHIRKIYQLEDPGYRGVPVYDQKTTNEIIETAVDLGWDFTAHVTGDASADMLLDAYEKVRSKKGGLKPRFSLMHGNFIDPGAMKRCRDMNIIMDIQPVWFYKDAEFLHWDLGEERMRWFHAYKTMLDHDLILCGGSDHMVKLDPMKAINPYNPFVGMYTLTTHITEHGQTLFPQERISRMEALKAYTINNAVKSREQHIKGSIEPGKLADFAVLQKDFLECTDRELLNMKVLETFVGGISVYKNPDPDS
jgi:predicted amidohydrolase YtcJ